MLIFTIDALIVPEMEAETSSTFVTFRHFLFDQIPFYARGPWFESPSHPSINAEIVWRKRISHIKNPRKSKFHYCWVVLQIPFTQTTSMPRIQDNRSFTTAELFCRYHLRKLYQCQEPKKIEVLILLNCSAYTIYANYLCTDWLLEFFFWGGGGGFSNQESLPRRLSDQIKIVEFP